MDLSTNYAGLTLKNPIIAASAGTTMDAYEAEKCNKAGYGAVVLKSVQEEELMRYNPFPRFKLVKNGIPGFSSHTFYCYEQAYYGDINAYAETVYQAKRRLDIPLVASINCLTPEKWGEYAIACEQAGADALEFVPSCPSGMMIRDPSNDIHTISVNAMKLCKEKVKIPVIPKMTGQVANVLANALDLCEAGADGLTMINRATGLDFDIETMAPILHGGVAGHGGPWALQGTLRWIAATSPQVKVPISATAGITTGEDAIKCFLAGADTVQIAAVVYLKGYDYVQVMLRQIKEYMERKGIEKLTDIIGRGVAGMKSMEEYDRRTRYTSSVDKEKCTKCGVCAPVCIYEAISYAKQDGADIDREKCDGCGLCTSMCPAGAIATYPKGE